MGKKNGIPSPHCKRVLAYMERYGSITSNEAEDFGCKRLAARISDLRHDYHYNISDKWEYGKNRFGEDSRWKRYFLEG